MFSSNTYQNRRQQLAKDVKQGIILLLGNTESPMNYRDNTYPFRQDSNFLYFTGLDQPDLALTIDTQTGESTLFGDDLSLDHIVWMGAKPSMRALAGKSGIEKVRRFDELPAYVQQHCQPDLAIHYPPPYRGHNILFLEKLTATPNVQVVDKASVPLIRAIIKQRSIKTAEEIEEMERAVNVSRDMHHAAMRATDAGQLEAYIAGIVEGQAISANGRLAYPAIVTVNGHILHNHYHGNTMREGQLLLIDAGAETNTRYAGDITRTFPVSKSFSSRQKDIYNIVLKAEIAAIEMLRPDILYRDVHTAAARIITEGLKSLGLMQGDTDAAVKAGAHALFFPHGLGHMIGMDVHDMEDLGEDYVGYTDEVQRSNQFGTRSLRLGRELQSGFVLTVEPGIYFIPALIEQWKADKKHDDFIRYDQLNDWYDFGGVRIEDNILITNTGHRILGEPIAKSIDEIEDLRK